MVSPINRGLAPDKTPVEHCRLQLVCWTVSTVRQSIIVSVKKFDERRCGGRWRAKEWRDGATTSDLNN